MDFWTLPKVMAPYLYRTSGETMRLGSHHQPPRVHGHRRPDSPV